MNITQLRVGSLQTSCYLLETEDEVLVIDPGGDFDTIVNNIKNPKAKVTILNTHHHYDHTLANNQLKEKFGAKILIHEQEKDYIDFEADHFLKNGEILKIGNTDLKILQTPGHTKGSICLLGDGFIFTGDTLFDGGYGRTDLPGGDSNQMFESLKKLKELLKKGTVVYPGHGDPFTWENHF